MASPVFAVQDAGRTIPTMKERGSWTKEEGVGRATTFDRQLNSFRKAQSSMSRRFDLFFLPGPLGHTERQIFHICVFPLHL
jgi:hypothetical protein